MDKKKSLMMFVKYGFWVMVGLFVLTIVFSFVGLQVVSDVLSVLFMVSILYVLITSVIAVSPPDKAFAYVALTICLLFILVILLIVFSVALGGSSGSAISGLK